MSFNINPGQVKTAKFLPTDASGAAQPLPAGNVPSWSTDRDGALTLAPAADGMSCQITGGSVGPVKLTCSVEADATPGVNPITAAIAGNVVAPEDTQATIEVD